MLAQDSDEDDEWDVTVADLKKSVQKVRGKITVIKERSLLKSKRRANSRVKKLTEVTAMMEARGIDVNKESLATRVKNPRRIADLEAAKDRRHKAELGLSSDSDDDDRELDGDKNMQDAEAENRGR